MVNPSGRGMWQRLAGNAFTSDISVVPPVYELTAPFVTGQCQLELLCLDIVFWHAVHSKAQVSRA